MGWRDCSALASLEEDPNSFLATKPGDSQPLEL